MSWPMKEFIWRELILANNFNCFLLLLATHTHIQRQKIAVTSTFIEKIRHEITSWQSFYMREDEEEEKYVITLLH